MPVTYVGGASAIGVGAVTVTAPARSVNDLLVVGVEGESSATMVTPSGWTLLQGPITSTLGSVTTDTRLWVFGRIADNTTADNITIPDLGNHAIVYMTVWRGLFSGYALSDITAVNSIEGTGATVPLPAITTPAADTMIVYVMSTGADTISQQITAFTDNGLTGPAYFGRNASSGTGGGVYFAHGVKTTAGSHSGATLTVDTAANSQGKALVALALSPTLGGGTPPPAYNPTQFLYFF